jgi:hypothetical protein
LSQCVTRSFGTCDALFQLTRCFCLQGPATAIQRFVRTLNGAVFRRAGRFLIPMAPATLPLQLWSAVAKSRRVMRKVIGQARPDACSSQGKTSENPPAATSQCDRWYRMGLPTYFAIRRNHGLTFKITCGHSSPRGSGPTMTRQGSERTGGLSSTEACCLKKRAVFNDRSGRKLNESSFSMFSRRCRQRGQPCSVPFSAHDLKLLATTPIVHSECSEPRPCDFSSECLSRPFHEHPSNGNRGPENGT